MIHGGSASGYRSGGCRCDECKAAHSARTKAERRQRQQRLPEADVVHGTWGTYSNWGCRCEECVRAGSEMNAENRRKRKERAA